MWAGRVGVGDWTGRSLATRISWKRSYAGEREPIHGASLGFTASAYMELEGFRALRSGEDRLCAKRGKRSGLRVRHDTRAVVRTSARRWRGPLGASHRLWTRSTREHCLSRPNRWRGWVEVGRAAQDAAMTGDDGRLSARRSRIAHRTAQLSASSRLLHRIDHLSSLPSVAVAVIVIVLGSVATGVALGLPGGWFASFGAAVSAITLLMVFAIQHTQAREQAATQRKLDELIRALPGASGEADDARRGAEGLPPGGGGGPAGHQDGGR